MSTYPNTGSLLAQPASGSTNFTNSGLSTQIIIRVNNQPVGALQTLTANQSRNIQRITEIGTDGVIEAVPNKATEYELDATRIVFDNLRLPEAFSRAFRFIGAQRLPFDIDIYDISNTAPNIVNAVNAGDNSSGIVVMTYKNCWFTNYSTPYQATDYIITETAKIIAETAFIPFPFGGLSSDSMGLRGLRAQTDRPTNVESSTNAGGRRGALDASGLLNTIFPT